MYNNLYNIGEKVRINRHFDAAWVKDFSPYSEEFIISGICISNSILNDGFEVEYTIKDSMGYTADGFYHDHLVRA